MTVLFFVEKYIAIIINILYIHRRYTRVWNPPFYQTLFGLFADQGVDIAIGATGLQ